jgi:uncharacterized membrane protein
MGTTKAFLTGTLLGAGAVYFFDPRTGNRRRTMAADQFRSLSRKAACAADAGIRDLGNRAQGVVHIAESFVESGQWPTSRRPQRQGSGKYPGGMGPGARLIAAACGTALMANCLARRTPSAVLLGTLGFGLFAKAVDAGPRGVHIEKTLDIDAPVDKVYDFFTHPQNWLRVSDSVTDVEVFDEGRFAKTMLVGGIPMRFEERFVRCKDKCLLESESEPGSAMKFCKQMKFEEIESGCTRVRMSFYYHPPGGTLGHAVATVFRIDAKTLLDDLLMRAKYFLETGREPHDAIARRKSQARPSEASSDGSHRGGASSELHGAGAPAEDVRRPGVRGFEQPSPWPESEEVASAEMPGEHFPTALD